MRLRPEPALATRFLKLFCATRDYESVIGDLVEQYQQGRGRFWYWRQVLIIVLLGLYGKAARRPLTATHRIPMGYVFAVILLILSLSALLLSDIAVIFLFPISAGVIVGILKFLHSIGQTEPARRAQSNTSAISGIGVPTPVGITPERAVESRGPALVRIDSSKIPVGGGAAAGILILILLIAVLHDLPQLRQLALPGLWGGLVVAVVLSMWRVWHPRDMAKKWVSLKLK